MVDLAKTQTEWNDFFKILGAEFQVLDAIESFWARMQKIRGQALIEFDENSIYSAVDLASETNIGVNTDSSGFLHITFTGGTSPSTQVYKDSGKAAAQLVASAATVSGVSTVLNEQNSSGYANLTVTIQNDPADNLATDSDIRWQITQDFPRHIETVYANDLTESEDIAEGLSKTKLRSRIANSLQNLYTNRRTDFRNDVLLTFMADFLAAPQSDRTSGSGFLYNYDTTTVNGQVLISGRRGIFPVMRQAMLDQSAPAGAQNVGQHTYTIGNLVPDVGNQGSLLGENLIASSATAITLVLSQHFIPGTMHLKTESDVIGRTVFSLENVVTDKLIVAAAVGSQSVTTITADNDARVSFRHQDGPVGTDFTLNYIAPIESGDDGNILSGVTITSPNATDTDIGKVFVRVETTAAIASGSSADEFTLTLFGNSGRSVAVGSSVIAGFSGVTSAVVITTSRSMVFTFTFNNVNGNTKLPNLNDRDDDIEFNLDPPRTGDKWTIAVSGTPTGFNSVLGPNWSGSLPDNSSPTISATTVKFFPTLDP